MNTATGRALALATLAIRDIDRALSLAIRLVEDATFLDIEGGTDGDDLVFSDEDGGDNEKLDDIQAHLEDLRRQLRKLNHYA
jgi:hypothetical protein